MIDMDITISILFFSIYNMTSLVNYESVIELLLWTHFDCQNVHRPILRLQNNDVTLGSAGASK